jgi:flavodoxin
MKGLVVYGIRYGTARIAEEISKILDDAEVEVDLNGKYYIILIE